MEIANTEHTAKTSKLARWIQLIPTISSYTDNVEFMERLDELLSGSLGGTVLKENKKFMDRGEMVKFGVVPLRVVANTGALVHKEVRKMVDELDGELSKMPSLWNKPVVILANILHQPPALSSKKSTHRPRKNEKEFRASADKFSRHVAQNRSKMGTSPEVLEEATKLLRKLVGVANTKLVTSKGVTKVQGERGNRSRAHDYALIPKPTGNRSRKHEKDEWTRDEHFDEDDEDDESVYSLSSDQYFGEDADEGELFDPENADDYSPAVVSEMMAHGIPGGPNALLGAIEGMKLAKTYKSDRS